MDVEALHSRAARRRRLTRVLAVLALLGTGVLGGVWAEKREQEQASARRLAANTKQLELLRRRIQEVSSQSSQVDAALAREPVLAASQLRTLSSIDRSVDRLERRAALAGEHADLLDQLDALAPAVAGQKIGPERRRVADAQVQFCRSMAGALQVLRGNEHAWKLDRDAPAFVSKSPEASEFARQLGAAKQSTVELAAALDKLNSETPNP